MRDGLFGGLAVVQVRGMWPAFGDRGKRNERDEKADLEHDFGNWFNSTKDQDVRLKETIWDLVKVDWWMVISLVSPTRTLA